MSISEFYKSKARQRKWGTWCNKCKKQLERGDELMRRQDGRNQNNCMTYTEYCMECYEKIKVNYVNMFYRVPPAPEQQKQIAEQAKVQLGEMQMEMEVELKELMKQLLLQLYGYKVE